MASRTSGQGGWLRHVRPLAAWFARDATVFTGLDQLTLPLLRQLADSAGSRRHIILIEPDEAHPLLDEARRAGARVIIGDPASPRLLRPIVSGLRGCELSRLYAVGARAADNEAVLAAAARILRRYSPDSQRQPRLVALIEDPRQAEAWRCSHGGTAGAWHEDALGLPRVELDDVVVEDSVLRLRSILAQVAALGRRWTPVRLVPSGSFVELSQADLERVATAEHARAYRRRLAAGSSAGGNGATPWTRLRDGERAERVTEVRRQLARLEEVGFLPVVPVGGPPTAASFERVGVVSARRLAAGLLWALPSGEELLGDAGDWRVVDDAGTVRTVTDVEFRSSHSQLDDGRWERIGVFRAWPARETVVIRTKEGSATARPGDWVVEGPGGERWPVRDGQFRRSYRPRQDLPATAGLRPFR
jgi:hypothetical protein